MYSNSLYIISYSLKLHEKGLKSLPLINVCVSTDSIFVFFIINNYDYLIIFNLMTAVFTNAIYLFELTQAMNESQF